MYEATKEQIRSQAELLCTRLEINPDRTDIILVMGDRESKTNRQAMEKWIEEMTDLIGLDQIAVRDKIFYRTTEYLDECMSKLLEEGVGGVH